ncbi:MAG: hypothetical protein AABX16_00460 [Nanoarchaeota archaeon]
MKKIFQPNLKLIITSLILFAINVLIILQLIPVLENQSGWAMFINLIIFPPNFIFEDVFDISSVKSIDIITWILQFMYDYLIAGILLYFMKGGTNKK